MKRGSATDVGVVAVILVSGWFLLLGMVAKSLSAYAWGPLDFGLTPDVVRILSLLTELGSEFSIFGIASLVYLTYDRRLGKKLFLLFIVSGWFNILAKGVFAVSRPPTPLARYTTEYAFPSGHTQLTASWTSYLALHFRRWSWFWGYVFAVLFIGFTRVALEVHFISDVLGGIFLGSLVAFGFFVFQGGVSSSRVLEKSNVRAFMVMVLPLLSIAFLVLTLDEVSVQAYELAGLAVGFGAGDTMTREMKMNRPRNRFDRLAIMVLLGVLMAPFAWMTFLVPPEMRWLSFIVAAVGGFLVSGVTPVLFSRLSAFSGFAV